MVSNSRPRCATSSSPAMRARASRSPSPIRRTAIARRDSGLRARAVSVTEAKRPMASPARVANNSSDVLLSLFARACSLFCTIASWLRSRTIWAASRNPS